MTGNFSIHYEYPVYDAVVPDAVTKGTVEEQPIVIVGAGPVGLAAAHDLAQHGIPSVVLDDDNTVSTGSRAICWAKRTLEIFDRLGVAAPMMDKGITWQKGRVFARDKEIYEFDLLPEPDHQFPAFINLQQYYVEQALVDAAIEDELIELRWQNKVVGVETRDDGALVTVETPDGAYRVDARYVIACDGARSPVRKMLGLDFVGRVFEDRFLIADVHMKADFPTERWFWFLPPFHQGPSTLLHKQADDIWRIDFQLGPDVDPDEEAKPENVIPRLKAMLGEDKEFDLDWVSVYRFQARRLEKFIHGPVIFAGDSAHQVSPFGARGGNSGIQDTDNLIWKLAYVLNGKAPASLIDTYDDERVFAAIENLKITSRTTDFMSAKGAVQTAFRDAALTLAERHPFARRFVNAGRLSTPTWLAESPLNTPDEDAFAAGIPPGAVVQDAPIRTASGEGWLLNHVGGRFVVIHAAEGQAPPVPDGIEIITIGGDIEDSSGRVAERYDMQPGTTYLVRPDEHVAARWRSFDPRKIAAARSRALAES